MLLHQRGQDLSFRIVVEPQGKVNKQTGKDAAEERTLSVKAYGFAGFPKGERTLSVRSRWSRPAPPKGELFGTFRQVEQNLPLRGRWHRVAMTERVRFPRSAALSQKAALQMPLPITTPPVKMQSRSVRRRSGFALLKIIFPLFMRKATRRAFQIVPLPASHFSASASLHSTQCRGRNSRHTGGAAV